jgi:hypothetical protein
MSCKEIGEAAKWTTAKHQSLSPLGRSNLSVRTNGTCFANSDLRVCLLKSANPCEGRRDFREWFGNVPPCVYIEALGGT